MTDDAIYKKLAKVLDTLPNGFPETETGVELKILKKIFTPEEAELFCELKLKFENIDQIAERTGRDTGELADMLAKMAQRGLIFEIDLEGTKIYKMLPWVFGIYEFQLNHLDKEFVTLNEEFAPYFAKTFFEHRPSLMRVVPVNKKLTDNQASLPYDQVSAIIEKGVSFGINECVCKKEKGILDGGCDKPREVCLAIAPVPGVFKDHPLGLREISKEEAYEVLRLSEEAGLVHLARNVQNGQDFICNCCGCCCGVLRSINEFGVSCGVVSNFYAEIDPDLCQQCGVCADERCQVNAIVETDDTYQVVREKCIGCGLCVSTCPADAITLLTKQPDELETAPEDEKHWFELRAQSRGVDYSKYI